MGIYGGLGVSINGCIKNGWFVVEHWMIWGYPHFRKATFGGVDKSVTPKLARWLISLNIQKSHG